MPIMFIDKPKDDLMSLGRAVDEAIRKQLGARMEITMLKRLIIEKLNLQIELSETGRLALTFIDGPSFDAGHLGTLYRGDQVDGVEFQLTPEIARQLIVLLGDVLKS